MNNFVEYKDKKAFHPGYYIADIIEDMGITQAEFAGRMGTTPKTLSKLVNGEANISNDLAKKLSVMLGTSVDIWLNLQNAYDKRLIEIEQDKDLDAQIELVESLDYSYFVALAGLPDSTDPREKIISLCSYLQVSDLHLLAYADFLNGKGSNGGDRNDINSAAWIQCAVNCSKNIQTRAYDAKKLRECISDIRKLTTQAPGMFIPRIKDILSECGVAFVMIPDLKGSYVSGVVKWVQNDRAVLAINNKVQNADAFWISLFREIKHVLQHKVTAVFVSKNHAAEAVTADRFDAEASAFARDCLIPPAAFRGFGLDHQTSDEEIIAFADSLGIHPGIVAGRLRSEGIISERRYKKLDEKYKFVL